MLHVLLTESPIDASGGLATILYILCALMALVGGGGLLGWWKGRKERAVFDDKVNQCVTKVLDPDNGMDAHTRTLGEIASKVSRNGGGSQSVGDIASRVEAAVAGMRKDVRGIRSQLDQHIGQHDERDASIATRVALLEGKEKRTHDT